MSFKNRWIKERVYVLPSILVTAPTFHLERSALKVVLLRKTFDMSVTADTSQSSIGPKLPVEPELI